MVSVSRSCKWSVWFTFPNNILYAVFITAVCVPCPSCLSLLHSDRPNTVWQRESVTRLLILQFHLRSLPLFLSLALSLSPLPLTLSVPNFLLSAPFPNTLKVKLSQTVHFTSNEFIFIYDLCQCSQQHRQRRMIELWMTNELQSIWKEAVEAKLKQCPGICLE